MSNQLRGLARSFRLHGAAIVGAGCLALLWSSGQGQATQTPAKSTQQPSSPEKQKPSTASEFPYPGEPAKPAGDAGKADSSAQPGSSSSQPDAPAPAAPDASPDKKFPYPGEAQPADGSVGSSSSSSSSSSADPTPYVDPDNPPVAEHADKFRRRLPKVRNLQTDDDREAEDLTVARYYLGRGNWNAAYLRSKDAVQHQADDPDAHLLLAEAALKLNKRDEAVAEYNSILKLDSSEGQIKAARKALERLQ